MKRRTFLAFGGSLALIGCAGRSVPRGVYEPTEVEAPAYRAGDRWTYRRTDGYNGLPRGILTRRVSAVTEGGYVIELRDEEGRLIDEAHFTREGLQQAGTFSEDGPMIGRCEPAYRKYDFPLASGKRWQQAFYLHRSDPGGLRNYVSMSAAVEGWEEVTVGERSYRALVIRRALNLGQKSFWESTLYRYETEWYAPALRSFVRLETREEFYRQRQRGLGALENGDRFIYELLSFEPAG